MKILVLCIYRTGPISKEFFGELDSLFGAASLKSDYIIVGGDFNVHTESINLCASDLLRTASSYGLQQLIDSTTHVSGGTIDLLFDNSNLIDPSSIEVLKDCNLSDHFPILCSTKKFQTIVKSPKVITTREMKKVDRDQLSIDLLEATSDFGLSDCFEDSINL